MLAYMARVGGTTYGGLLEVAAALIGRFTADHTRCMSPATVDSLLLLEGLLRGDIPRKITLSAGRATLHWKFTRQNPKP